MTKSFPMILYFRISIVNISLTLDYMHKILSHMTIELADGLQRMRYGILAFRIVPFLSIPTEN